MQHFGPREVSQKDGSLTKVVQDANRDRCPEIQLSGIPGTAPACMQAFEATAQA